MCGIAGFADFETDVRKYERTINAMSDALKRRGPDEKGEYVAEHIALIHRRLAIVDIENGKQPMRRNTGGGEYVLIYNGELYNTAELRRELTGLGYEFEGHSDTEILLLSYIEWGIGCLKKLNGIFAFAVYDKRDEKIVLARDGGGVKPLFYHYDEARNTLVFGSEIKALLEHPDISSRVDKYGVAEVFLIGPGRTPGGTAFIDIDEIKPGHYAEFSRDGFYIKPFWELSAREHTDSADDTIEKVRYLVEDAVRRQLNSDVPLCTLLSGGLDSSIITKVASDKFKNESKTLNTYSVTYTDNEKYFTKSFYQPTGDDAFINIMSEFTGSNHTVVTLDNDEVGDALFDSTIARDLPGMADIESSMLLLFREIRKKFKVALSGECADEIFGGYPWYTNKEMLNAADFPWSGNTEIKAGLINEKYTTFDPTEYVNSRYRETIASAPMTGYESDIDRRIKEVSVLNFKWFMQTLLDRKDRTSMYNGLEVRVPFCDLRIMEYVYNIPWEIKAYSGREKGLLRKAFSGILPDEIIYRKKSPYPKSHNPVYLNNVKAKVEKILADKNSPLLEIVDAKKLRELIDTEAGMFNKPWYGQLMNFPQILGYMYMIDVWLREYDVDIV
ncbi:MAG TPA: asparagine synthase (glutamine-hydrolyzing) [Firmicutes bacterium]|nr:asparagine synthase (glutamine-hydrolyzing) [Bacillota bacterium]